MAWQPSDYNFQPFSLEVEKKSPGSIADANVKRKGGRQKRSSILCQVEGCGAELINEKTYYKRYRICLTHCNMKSMVIQGRRQRFCQQCGRFHDLSEFEGARKSCRRKLERHNQRRRSMPSSKGACTWQSDTEEEDGGTESGDEEFAVLASMKRTRRSTRSGAGEKRCYTGSPTSSLQKIHSSSDGAAQRSSGTGAGPMDDEVQGRRAALPPLPEAHPTNSESLAFRAAAPAARPAAFCGPSPFAAGEFVPKEENVFMGMGVLTMDDIGADGLLLFPEDPSDSLVISDPGNPGLGGAGTAAAALRQQSAPAPCAARPAYAPERAVSDIAGWGNTAFPQPLPATAQPMGMGLGPAPASLGLDFMMGGMSTAGPSSLAPQAPSAPALDFFGLPLDAGTGSSAMHAAASMVSYNAPALVGYNMEETLLRLSVKLFNCTPDMLVPKVRSELISLLKVAESSLLEGYLRPGCVHLTLCARVTAQEAAAAAAAAKTGDGLAAAVEALLARSDSALPDAACGAMHLQLNDELVVVKGRRVMAAIDTGKSAGIVPRIAAVRPMAVGLAPGQRRTHLLLAGTRLGEPEALIMARQGGRNLTVEIPEDESAGLLDVSVLGLAPGCAELEVQAGSFLGPSLPLLVLSDEAAAEEVRQLERAGAPVAAGIPCIQSFLRDIGFVAQFLDRDAAQEEGRPVMDYTPALLAKVQAMACRLVATAVARGWAALAGYLLPATTAAGQSRAAAAAAMDAACPAGATLLHVAVGTSRAAVVRRLAEWTSAAVPGAPAPWAVDARGPAGVTPLHVAAILPDALRAEMRAALVALNPAADKLWSLATADDGTTPETLIEAVAGAAQEAAARETARKLAAEAAAAAAAERDASEIVAVGGKAVAAATTGRLPRMAWKSRNEAKELLVDFHINSMMEEVDALQVRGDTGRGEGRQGRARGAMLGAAVLRSAIAAALGAVIVSLRPM